MQTVKLTLSIERAKYRAIVGEAFPMAKTINIHKQDLWLDKDDRIDFF